MSDVLGRVLMRMRYGRCPYRRAIAHTMPARNMRPAISAPAEYAS